MLSLEQNTELANLLVRIHKEKLPVYLWQNPENIQRIGVKARYHRYNLGAEELTFFPVNGEFPFVGRLPIYFYYKNQSIIFKNYIRYNSHHKIIVPFPKKVMMEELRLNPRSSFKSVNVLINYTHFRGGQDPYQNLALRSRLIDRSQGGLSFRSSLNNIVQFRKGDLIKIQTEDKLKMLNAKINYICIQYDHKTSEKYYRVGVIFDSDSKSNK